MLDAQERSQVKSSRKNNSSNCELPESPNFLSTPFGVLGADLPGSSGKTRVYSNKFVSLSGQSLRDFQQLRLADSSKNCLSQRRAAHHNCGTSNDLGIRPAIVKYTAKAPNGCASNYSFKPRPLRGLAHALVCSTPLRRCASRLNSGVRQRTKRFFCAFPRTGRPRFSKFFWPLSHLSHDFGDFRSKVLAWGTISGVWLRMIKHWPPTSAGLHQVTIGSRLVRLSP